jgi:hypothetical protein
LGAIPPRNKNAKCQNLAAGWSLKRNNEQYEGGLVLVFVGPFVIAQLALPTQSPRLGRDLFGFGDQAFLLVKN